VIFFQKVFALIFQFFRQLVDGKWVLDVNTGRPIQDAKKLEDGTEVKAYWPLGILQEGISNYFDAIIADLGTTSKGSKSYISKLCLSIR